MTAHKPTATDPLENLLAAEFWKRISLPRFRGEIYDDDIDNEHLKEFLACHFYRKILRDALKDSTRRQGLRAANQIGKSRIGELIMKHWMKYSPANMIIYDETIEKSRDHMANRFGPLLKSIPQLGEAFREVVESNRFDVTTQDIRLPGMVFRARPLNEAWTQSITVKCGMISDAALCDPRQIRRAFIRSRRHEGEDYWFVESQGDAIEGKMGGGFKEFMGTTNEMKLWVRCPCCQTRQRFLFYHKRTQDTLIVPPLSVPTQDRESWLKHNKPILLSPEREHCGFKVEGELKRDDGGFDDKQIMRHTVYECPHCGEIWRDNTETRRYLDHEAGLDENWIATNSKALPGYLGYSLPTWINPIISWGSAMLFFRQAMAAKKLGTLINLQEFRTKWEGEDWEPSEFSESKQTISAGTYDPMKYLEMFGLDEKGVSLFHSVNMAVDCQEDADHKARTEKSITGWFWYIVRAYDRFGNNKQLARGYCKSWAAWRAVQAFWGVPNDRVMIDVVQWSEQVMNKAVEFRQMVKRSRPHPIFKTMEDMVTWKLLAASPGKQNFKGHRDGQIRAWSPEADVYGSMIDEAGKVRRIQLKRILFNKTPVMLHIDSLYSGAPGLPKFEFLSRNQLKCPSADGKELVPDTLTLSMEIDGRNGKPTMLAYENQMSAQIYNRETNKYDELRADDHYYWCEQALLVRVGQDGLLGQSAVFTEKE